MGILCALVWDTYVNSASVQFDMSADEGVSAVSIGDFNGDGQPDLAVGCSLGDYSGRTDCGMVYIFYGPIEFGSLSAETEADVRIYGANSEDYVGSALACADINEDGIDDLVIGAPGLDHNGKSNCGGAYVVFGCTHLPPFFDLNNTDCLSNCCQIFGEDAEDMAGASVLAADVAGTGLPVDVLIGAPGGDGPENSREQCGQVHAVTTGVYEGAIVDLSITGFKVYGANPFDALGFDMACGDINGDGVEDVAISAPFYQDDFTKQDQGAVFVLYGRFRGDKDLSSSSDYDLILKGQQALGKLGWSVACGNLLTSSSTDEVAAGAPFVDHEGRVDCGACYVFDGDTIAFKVYGDFERAFLGFDAECGDIGDSDTDATPDLMMGAPGTPGSSSGCGAVFVESGGDLSGTLDLAVSSCDFTFYGNKTNAGLGAQIVCKNLCTGSSTLELLALSKSSGFVFDTDVPCAPEWKRLECGVNGGTFGVHIGWRKSPISESCNVYRNGGKITPSPVAENSYFDSDVSEGEWYTYSIKAYNQDSGKESAASEEKSVFFLKVPTNFTAEVEGSTVKLSWQDNSSIEEKYEIRRGEDFVKELPADTTSYTDTSPSEGQLHYCVAIFGKDADDNLIEAGCSPTVAVYFIKPPEGLGATVDGRKVTLVWSDQSQIEEAYRIFKGRRSGQYSYKKDFSDYATCGSGTGTVTFEDYPGEGDWYYIVKARKDNKFSWASNEVHVFVSVPNPPTECMAKLTEFGVKLTWKDNSSLEKGYRIYRLAYGQQQVVELPANTQEYLDPDPPFGKIVYKVVAFNDKGEESPPAEAVIKRVAKTQRGQNVVILSNVVKKGNRFGIYSAEDGFISVYDAEGNKVADYTVKQGQVKYMPAEFPTGMYYVLIKTSSGKIVKRKLLVVK